MWNFDRRRLYILQEAGLFSSAAMATKLCFESVVSGTPKGFGNESDLFMVNPKFERCSAKDSRKMWFNGKLDNPL